MPRVPQRKGGSQEVPRDRGREGSRGEAPDVSLPGSWAWRWLVKMCIRILKTSGSQNWSGIILPSINNRQVQRGIGPHTMGEGWVCSPLEKGLTDH